MKLPGPDHPITITPTAGRVVVKAGGKVVADTRRALTLQEASYPPVQYIPRDDARMDLLTRGMHQTHCPYKGDAAYYTLGAGAENAVWTYEQPFPAVAEIAGHLAFYPNKVDSIEIEP
jgi:uncharacterized protein (DUF427 family)